jgi:large conductance mechanosensitive channel
VTLASQWRGEYSKAILPKFFLAIKTARKLRYTSQNSRGENAMRGFKQFLLRGNVVDLAVGVVIGAAFAALVAAVVKDLLMPLIGAVAKLPDFSNMSFTINGSKFSYGDLLNALLAFLIAAASVYFLVVLPINRLMSKVKKTPDPNTRQCTECLSEIPLQARRCKFCTATTSLA